MRNFQVITLVVFIALAIFGILVFSGAIPIGNKDQAGGLGTVVLWGTVRAEMMAPILEEFNSVNMTFVIKYEQKSVDTFDRDLLEALAGSRGPDLFFLPDDLAFHYADKIFTIPYQSYPLASFKNNFAGAGDVFLTSRGIMAIPIGVDPLMMYYNRSMLDASGVVHPPKFWDEIAAFVSAIAQKDDANKIIKSPIALGHFGNIAHAKDIISALFMQAGNPIVTEKDGSFRSSLNSAGPGQNLSSVLQFYTDFADPNKSVYSWNRSFPNSSKAFSREDLALYFGFASELKSLINKNPNQNFLAAPFPQIKNSNFKLTAARVTGLALLSSSRNFSTAYTAMNLLATGNFASKFATAAAVAPARRDLLQAKPSGDAYFPVFYDSALYGRSWLDPSPEDTDNIFRRMVDGVLSNSMTLEGAISDANSKLSVLLIR